MGGFEYIVYLITVQNLTKKRLLYGVAISFLFLFLFPIRLLITFIGLLLGCSQ